MIDMELCSSTPTAWSGRRGAGNYRHEGYAVRRLLRNKSAERFRNETIREDGISSAIVVSARDYTEAREVVAQRTASVFGHLDKPADVKDEVPSVCTVRSPAR